MLDIPKITALDLAFPARALEWMPAREDLPEEYRSRNVRLRWGHELFTDLFFGGLDAIALRPKDGVDADEAWKVIRATMGSFAPKHEHKEEVVAYFIEEWFDSAEWVVKGITKEGK